MTKEQELVYKIHIEKLFKDVDISDQINILESICKRKRRENSVRINDEINIFKSKIGKNVYK